VSGCGDRNALPFSKRILNTIISYPRLSTSHFFLTDQHGYEKTNQHMIFMSMIFILIKVKFNININNDELLKTI
jgi:hypothetical protein